MTFTHHRAALKQGRFQAVVNQVLGGVRVHGREWVVEEHVLGV